MYALLFLHIQCIVRMQTVLFKVLIMSSFGAEPVAGTSSSCVVEGNCVIESLFTQQFSSRSFTDTLNIVSSSSSTPLIPVSYTHLDVYKRQYQLHEKPSLQYRNL